MCTGWLEDGPKCDGGAGDRWPGSVDAGLCRWEAGTQLASRGGLMGSDLILTGGDEAGGGVEELTLRCGKPECDIPNEPGFHWRERTAFRNIPGENRCLSMY